MKPEELMNSLDYVGEDLLAATEQTIRVREKRSWGKAAVAAVLALAVGVGGWFGLTRLDLGAHSAAPGGSNPTIYETTDPGDRPQAVRAFSVEDSHNGLRLTWNSATASEDMLALRQALGQEDQYAGLTVYANPHYMQGEPIPPEEREALALQTAQAFGLNTEGVKVSSDDFSSHLTTPEACNIDVGPVGQITLHLEHPLTFPEAAGDPEAAAKALLTQRLGVRDPENWAVLCTPQPDELESIYVCRAFPRRTDPAQQLTSFTFEGIYMILQGEACDISYLTLAALPEPQNDPEAWPLISKWAEPLGDYPIISLETARLQALGGAYFADFGAFQSYDPQTGTPHLEALPVVTEETLDCWSIVYLDFTDNQYLLPYYRFLVPMEGNEKTMGVIYVPAVQNEYLTDYGPDPVARSEDPNVVPTEPVAPPTEHESGWVPPPTEGEVKVTLSDTEEDLVQEQQRIFGLLVGSELQSQEEPVPGQETRQTVWRFEGLNYRGQETIRELRFGKDMGFTYRDGDPNSEFSYWARGSWALEGTRLVLYGQPVDELGQAVEAQGGGYEMFMANFDVKEITRDVLKLRLRSGEGIHDETIDEDLTFRPLEQTWTAVENQASMTYPDVNRVLTALAAQGIDNLEEDLGNEYKMVNFVHIYAKQHPQYDLPTTEPDLWPGQSQARITYEDRDGQSWETLTLEQVNAFLGGLLSRRVEAPAVSPLETEVVDWVQELLDLYQDGKFWFPAADGDVPARFALCDDLKVLDGSGSYTGLEVHFRVYEARTETWDAYPWDLFPDLSLEQAEELVENGQLVQVQTGTAILRKQDNTLRLETYQAE